MTSPLDALLDFGVDILSTTLDKATGRILAYLGDVKAKRSESDAAQFMQHVGMATRPRKAEPGKSAAQCVRICRSNGDVVIASSDSRTQEMYGQLDDGESAFFASDGQARALFKKDGSVSLYTTDDNTATGKGVYLKISPTAFEFFAPWGRLVFDPTGFHAVTTSGARLDLGGIGGLPGPLSAIGSYATLSAASVKCEGSIVFLGAGAVYDAALHGLTGIAGLPSTGVFVSV